MQHLRSDNLFHVGICIYYLGLKESTSLCKIPAKLGRNTAKGRD